MVRDNVSYASSGTATLKLRNLWFQQVIFDIFLVRRNCISPCRLKTAIMICRLADVLKEFKYLVTETSGSSSHKTKKRPVVEDDSQNEKVLTCMGCGHLFESLQVILLARFKLYFVALT